MTVVIAVKTCFRCHNVLTLYVDIWPSKPSPDRIYKCENPVCELTWFLPSQVEI